MRSLTEHTATDLLSEADTATERLASITRLLVGVVLLTGLQSLARNTEDLERVSALVFYASVMTGIVIGTGALALLFIRIGRWRPWMAYFTATVDALVLAILLHYSFEVSALPAEFIFAFPIVGTIPLFLGVGMLRFRPPVQVYASFLFVAGSLVVLTEAGVGNYTSVGPTGIIDTLFSWPPNAMRFVMLLLTAGVLILAASRGRRMLRRAVDETANRLNLSRFLPIELAPLMASGALSAPRTGRRANVTLLFVDIRDSTAIEENAEPDRLVAIISEFRTRILEAAAAHAGVVDKFVGDGAFLVFGVPNEKADDAARALRCGKAILASIQEWNDSRTAQGDDPIRIGIGIHAGEAFVGIVGARSRLEFAVLGDAVNVASRIERETKVHREPLLVSARALFLAKENPAEWRSLGVRTLRGRSEPVELFGLPAR